MSIRKFMARAARVHQDGIANARKMLSYRLTLFDKVTHNKGAGVEVALGASGEAVALLSWKRGAGAGHAFVPADIAELRDSYS